MLGISIRCSWGQEAEAVRLGPAGCCGHVLASVTVIACGPHSPGHASRSKPHAPREAGSADGGMHMCVMSAGMLAGEGGRWTAGWSDAEQYLGVQGLRVPLPGPRRRMPGSC